MKKNKDQRSPQSKMLLTLSMGTAIGILPFAIYRMIHNDWSVAILDIIVSFFMLGIYSYVYQTDKVKNAGVVLVISALLANVISFHLKGISQVYWVYPAMMFAYFITQPLRAVLINSIMLLFYIPKLVVTHESVSTATVIITIIVTNIFAYLFASGLRKQEKKLIKLASEDYLTGAGNRRSLSNHLENLHAVLKNHDKTASIMLIDLDHFKNVNDMYGHIKGDDVLVTISNNLRTFCNECSKLFRFGGEEFLLVCQNVDIDFAFDKAEELREYIKRQNIVEGIELTISIGVAEYIKEESISDWIHRVDLALYQAKNEGRDRVIKG
ncbi:MAG TPA: GGDEF domain-containing protein [Gammaproteobacteria bacterium]|nr:GGDEF domain-containing protein [Xanthomonadales bacterium]HPI95463.1 GGDEF domain-containing protein [Gammaproteobacteria bacterium]